MKVTTEKLEKCQIALNIEAEASELDEHLNAAYRHLVNRISMPGFRKGKAPRAVLEQYMGKGALMREALEHLIPQLYKKAIESQQIEPIDEPQIEVVQTSPVVFKAVVPLKPTIKLGNYHDINIEFKPVEINEQEIQAALEQVRQEQATWIPMDRPVQFGDLVTINVEAGVEGKPFLNHKDMVYEVNKGSTFPLPGFAQNLVAVEKNKERTFNISIPADYRAREFAGKECWFKVTVTEIKEKELPQLSDELAQSLGYDDLAAMKEKVAASLRTKAEGRSGLELRQKVLDAAVALGEVDYPPVLEDREVDKLLQDEARSLGFREVEEYLQRNNKTRERRWEELRPLAKKRLISSLVLDRIVEEEKVEISAAEVDNEIRSMVENAEDKEKAGQFFALPQIRESIERSLRSQKTMDKLVQIATGSAKDQTKES